MRILHRYMATVLLKYAAFLVCMFAALMGFMGLLHDFHRISPQYTFFNALYAVCLQLPYTVYALMPIIGVLSVAMGISELARHREWLMLQVFGMGPVQRWYVVGIASALIVVITTGIGEGIGPYGNFWALKMRSALLPPAMKKHMLVLPQGIWLKQGTEWVHLHTPGQTGHIIGMVRYRFDKKGGLSAVHYAESGQLHAGQLVAKQGWASQFIHASPPANRVGKQQIPQRTSNVANAVKTGHLPVASYVGHRTSPSVVAVHVTHYDTAQWPVHLYAPLLPLLQRDAQTQSLWMLSRNMRYRRASQMVDRNMEYVYWQRWVQPFYTWLMMCGVGSLLCASALSTRQGGGQYIVGAVIVGVGGYALQQVSGMVSVALSWPGWWGALLPVGIFVIMLGLVACFACIRRVGGCIKRCASVSV